MGSRELQAKYGASSTVQALPRAVREEIPGGREAMDAMEMLHQLVRRTNSPEAGQALNAVRGIVDAMEAEVRRRYGMPAR